MLLAAAGPAHADHSVIEHASVGTTGGNGTQHVFSYYPAADGSRVFFETSEALTADDTDTRVDIYEHVVGGGTNLVSTGPQGGNGAFDASFENTNPDGSHVLFRTAEQLVAADTDAVEDVYDRSGGTTTLVSTGPQATTCFFGPSTAYSYAISPDGTRILFTSSDKLVPEDVDCGGDVYERAGGTTTLVSKGSPDAGLRLVRPSGSGGLLLRPDHGVLRFRRRGSSLRDTDSSRTSTSARAA